MFTPVLSKPPRAEELFAAWAMAAQESRVAWETWLGSGPRHRGDAYAGYRASLDR
jgi:hypothetical protein